MIEVVLYPSSIGRYVAMLGNTPLIKPTRQPFFNAARALLETGSDPDEELIARHRGSTTIAMRSTVGEAAKWEIHETDKGGLTKRLWTGSRVSIQRKEAGRTPSRHSMPETE